MWHSLHHLLLEELAEAERIDWSRASIDSAAIPAKKGRRDRPQPIDRGRSGTKHHVVVDGHGTPLALRQPSRQLLSVYQRAAARQ